MYSQHGIEPILDELLPEQGFFLEIGAWDGTHFSNSKYLEEKGWKGLCVEPFPRNFVSRITPVCTKAISSDGLPRIFIKVEEDKRHGGDVSYLSGFKDSLFFHWEMIKEHCFYQEVLVDTITMQDLYKEYSLPRHIDFLSVDVEGAEMEVFNGIDFKKKTFGMILFEHNGVEKVRRDVAYILHQHGYLRYPIWEVELKLDDIYVRIIN